MHARQGLISPAPGFDPMREVEQPAQLFCIEIGDVEEVAAEESAH
jgi:hypothetical protein